MVCQGRVYLRARERLTRPVGLTEWECARSVFAQHDAGWITVWHKIRSNLLASETVDQYAV